MSTQQPFNFSHAMYRLCSDVSRRLPEFHHVDMDRIAVAFAQARRNVPYGMQAKLTPLRFENGALQTTRYGRKWTVQRVYQDQQEMLYILTFYLPRFLNHSFKEKMITVLHELYHISPAFDGDIRRLAGHYHVHSHSQKEYDAHMAVMVDQYMKLNPPPELFGFLKCRFSTLQKKHGDVVGLQIPIPKLIPVTDTRIA